MKISTFSLLLILLSLLSCKTEKKSENTTEPAPEMTITEKVALAHGYDHWKNVQELRFTFNVDRDTMHFERNWTWHPKTQQVRLITGGDTISYNRKAVDSTLAQQDGGFINDKFWFLVPYQLIWDQGSFTHEYAPEALAPVSGDTMQKLTIVYGNEGGYTPGDAYDLYLDEQNMVREWTFRRGNKPAPGSDATWEGYQEVAGLQLATMHQLGGGATLYFTDIEVITE